MSEHKVRVMSCVICDKKVGKRGFIRPPCGHRHHAMCASDYVSVVRGEMECASCGAEYEAVFGFMGTVGPPFKPISEAVVEDAKAAVGALELNPDTKMCMKDAINSMKHFNTVLMGVRDAGAFVSVLAKMPLRLIIRAPEIQMVSDAPMWDLGVIVFGVPPMAVEWQEKCNVLMYVHSIGGGERNMGVHHQAAGIIQMRGILWKRKTQGHFIAVTKKLTELMRKHPEAADFIRTRDALESAWTRHQNGKSTAEELGAVFRAYRPIYDQLAGVYEEPDVIAQIEGALVGAAGEAGAI